MKSRNFFYLIIGRIFTNIGDSLYAVASMWLVYDLTGNSFFTGLAGFLTMSPVALQFIIGPLINQSRYKNILIYSQMIQAVLLTIIPIASLFNILSVWMVLVIIPIASIIQQFVYPTQQAVLPSIVEKRYLTQANSIMTATYQILDVILLGISGIIIAILGIISVYMLSSATFFMAMTLFFYLKVPKTKFDENDDLDLDNFTFKDKWKNYTADLKEGYKFINNSFIPKFLIAAILANFIIGAVSAILPEYASQRGGSYIYGWYLGAMSAGLFMGTLASNFFQRYPLGKVTIIGFLCSGISWLFAGITNITLLSIILYGGSYIVIGITNVLFLSSLQRVIPESFLGRVFSFVAGATTLSAPLGALIGGAVATLATSSLIFISGSVATMFVSVYWMLTPTLRKLPKTESFNQENFFKAEQI